MSSERQDNAYLSGYCAPSRFASLTAELAHYRVYARMAKLCITDENGKERVHELIDDVTTVGRASVNIIQVTDEKASRSHFRVEKSGERFKLVDLGSTNGTKINGNKISGEIFLRPGDKIGLGKTIFLYDGPGAAPEPSAAAIAEGRTVEMSPLELKGPVDEAKYVLRVKEGANVGKIYELSAAPLTLGRHNSNTIQVIDDAASNYHAEVCREPIGYVVTDLGSTNGTRVKPKNKADFEKVVKATLSSGMQIRIGKTVLEFDNIGKPVEEEALFGTVALDPDKLEAKLAEPTKSRAPMALIGAVAGIVCVGAAFVVMKLSNNPVKPDKPVAPTVVFDTNNKVQNGDFSDGTDDEGNPKNYKIERSPGVKVEVIAEADRAQADNSAEPQPKDSRKKLGLRVTKTGRSASALSAVESNSFQVDPGKSYELSGWMRNDGDGLFGLRVTWIQGERKFVDHPIVLKDTQEWKEKKITITPPSWAQRAKVGVFVQGKDGKACFDDLAFKEKPNAEPTQPASVKFGAIGLNFEGTKGIFNATSQGERVLEDGNIVLVTPDNNATSELTSAISPQEKKSADGAALSGQIYDFAMQELTNYNIDAHQGAGGVDLSIAVDPHENGSRVKLKFYVVGPAAQGDVEAMKSGTESERMSSADASKTFSGVQEILFNAGKAPQFDLTFKKPADVEIKREGNRRAVTIAFSGELQLGLAPESILAKQQMLQAAGDIRKILEAKRWGEAEVKLAEFRKGYESKFPQANDEAAKFQQFIDNAWRESQDEVKRTLDSLNLVKTPGAATAARDTINRHIQSWAGGERVAQLQEKLKFIDEFEKQNANQNAEQEAEKMYAQAERYFNNKAYSVAISIIRVKILNDPVNKNTKAAEKAKDLLPKAEAAEQRQQELTGISTRLREKVKNYVAANDVKGAIDAIEKDPEYQANKADLPLIDELLKDLRRKLQ